MSLADFWFMLFVAVIAAYIVLDGFDLGVGMLHPFAAKEDRERRIVLNSIGPIWDGNEVWLVVGGGVLFAAFPVVYASMFSGFYWALMLVLIALILRTVAIEFRGKRESSRWRRLWDSVFSASSFGLALLLGVAFGNVVTGVPLDKNGEVQIGSLLDLLHPFVLFLGVTTVAMLLMHGALYLVVKTEGDLQARVRRWVPRLHRPVHPHGGDLGRVDRGRGLRGDGHVHGRRVDPRVPDGRPSRLRADDRHGAPRQGHRRVLQQLGGPRPLVRDRSRPACTRTC